MCTDKGIVKLERDPRTVTERRLKLAGNSIEIGVLLQYR